MLEGHKKTVNSLMFKYAESKGVARSDPSKTQVTETKESTIGAGFKTMEQIREEARKNVEQKKQQRDQQRFQQQQLEKDTQRTEYTDTGDQGLTSFEDQRRAPITITNASI